MRLRPALFAATIGIAALASAASAQTTLRIGLQEDPDTLDAAKNWSFVGRQIFASMCDKIVDIAPDQSFVPQIAHGMVDRRRRQVDDVQDPPRHDVP